jgi:tRNA pseudouridine32 synthase/23S rRNA pseudouridine746 synthase
MCYQPDAVGRAAAEDLMQRLGRDTRWRDYFGSPEASGERPGKMFGVLVVLTPSGKRGYLAAFSGKAIGSNHHPGFVPPVYDLLDDAGFYRREEQRTNAMTRELEQLQNDGSLDHARQELQAVERRAADELRQLRTQHKEAKRHRHQLRKQLGSTITEAQESELRAQSIAQSYGEKKLKAFGKELIFQKKKILDEYLASVDNLRQRRMEQSARLQRRIFSHYTFLNAAGESRTALDIFQDTALGHPPAGAGDCCAPKLFQYAFGHGLQPVTLAEFWYGAAPPSSLRRHGRYYPACRGKCEPILGHMLAGSPVADNPLLVNPAEGKRLTTVYEDDHLLVVSKPADFLSVPGRHIQDSVQSRLGERLNGASGPLLVHRLDMSTSGLLLVAKEKGVHQKLQRQFLRRTVTKRYVAILDGVPTTSEGVIDLPLRGDYCDRPRQRVCLEQGKPSLTRWKLVGSSGGRALLHLWPQTGRTHQLRVHCAHSRGLGIPIRGDDLYGQSADRLYLHAEALSFRHPVSRRHLTLTDAAPFGL